jgi:acylglycerol lipase
MFADDGLWAPWVMAVMWSFAYLAASRSWGLPRVFGRTVVGGMEMWRNAWSMPTQFVILPVAFACRGEVADHLFMYVFALYMVLDLFLAGHLDFIFKVHHGACLLGHSLVVFALPAEAFTVYFSGVVALEIGSGAMNMWVLAGQKARWANALYAVVMTASNAAAAYVAWQWSQLDIKILPKAICLAVAAALIVLRQQACHENVRIGAPRHLLRMVKQRWSKVYLTPKYVAASFVTFGVPLILLETISKDVGVTLLVFFGLLSCFGRVVGRTSRKKWKAAASLWPSKLPLPLILERSYLINRHRLKLQRFTIKAERPKAVCILVHGYGQSAHFEFLCATYPGGPHSIWDDSILQHLADAGISCYSMDLQGHGESEGARDLRGYFEDFDDLAYDLLQLHGVVRDETGGELPIYWLGCSMGSAVACRATQLDANSGVAGMVMLAPMISLEKVAQKSVLGPIKNKHLAPIGGLLSFLVPTLPLVAKSESVLAQQIDKEFRNDTTNYTGSVRVRVANHFNNACNAFISPTGPRRLERVTCPAMLIIHANGDTMTEPNGSVQLFERASCARKTLILISGPDGSAGAIKLYANGKRKDGLPKGLPGMAALRGLNMWHSITTEPGCEKVSAAVAEWICKEAGDLHKTSGVVPPEPSPQRRSTVSPTRQRYVARSAAKA